MPPFVAKLIPQLLPARLRGRGPGALIREGWDTLRVLPGGARLFHRLLGAAIPYTGALGAQIVTLEHGFARVQLAERRAIQNHLKSIHAVALVNLAELTGNLALAYTLPDDARFIVTALSIEYSKKARGVIEATCRTEPPKTSERREYELRVEIEDQSGARVASAVLKTLVSPIA
jgi:uncharacterized protein (TIGR00369 family)